MEEINMSENLIVTIKLIGTLLTFCEVLLIWRYNNTHNPVLPKISLGTAIVVAILYLLTIGQADGFTYFIIAIQIFLIVVFAKQIKDNGK